MSTNVIGRILTKKENKTYDTIIQKASEGEKRQFWFRASDETPDRYGDVIRAKGWDTKNFFKGGPGPLLFNHHSDEIVGRIVKTEIRGKEFWALAEFPEKGVNEKADQVFWMLENGFLKSFSVGFMPLEYKEIWEKDNFIGYEFTKQELLEISVVTIPANPNAHKDFGGEAMNEIIKKMSEQMFKLFEKVEEQEQKIKELEDKIETKSAEKDEEQETMTDEEKKLLEKLEELEKKLGNIGGKENE